MSASWPGNMRGPRLKTLLLLLVLLLTSVTATEEEDELLESAPEAAPTDPADPTETESGDPDPGVEETSQSTTSVDPVDYGGEDASGDPTEPSPTIGTTHSDEDDPVLNPMIILIPVVLVVLIIGIIVCGIFINRRWNRNARHQDLSKEDPCLDGSSAEKVPMPMFEEDVPSVLELEMEELDQWMKKDGESAEDSTHA
ncbi:transmembrane protein 154 isoform X3 [Mugil cephalus]|uniref:transmembrane protein 154 isoform X3 n=1 Tax=Mugil cephalus TaxID=48193 RepID=UPI001FB5DE8E|nr:transmembrane protein 154 isoform X3 [Mugil cephalus]